MKARIGSGALLGIVALWSGVLFGAPPVVSYGASHVAPLEPKIAGLLKPAALKRVLEERDVVVHAGLEDIPKTTLKRYGIHAGMLVKAEHGLTRRVLTDYAVYAKMIPYIDRAAFDPKTLTLQVEGGIWKFKLSSLVRFEEKSSNWIHFRIIGGHFTGLEGEMLFESQGERGTAVFVNGELTGAHWPPRFVIERGAEIVFGFTAKRMRSYIESQKKEEAPHVDSHGEIPQPRNRLWK